MHDYFGIPVRQADGTFGELGYASSLRGLGGIEEDIVRLFSLIPGGAQLAQQKLAQFEQLIRDKAKEGALQAVPQIKAEVEKTVKPFVIAALFLGAGGLLFGFATWLQNKRTR